MANISTWLQKIATAIYGKDMREAIHDSIEAVNNDLENDKILTDGKLGAKADKAYNKGFVGGQNASLGGEGGAALGLEAKASKGAAAGAHAQASEGGSAGNGAYTSHGGSVGQNAYSLHGASIGRNTKTRLGVAAGDNAQTVNEEGEAIDAIQLGTGTNTNEKTFKVYEFQMMDNNGIIPVERLPEDTYMKVKKSLITEPDFPNEDYSTIIYRIEHSYEDPNKGLTETCSHYILSGVKDDEYVWEKILTGTISSENTSFCGYSTTPQRIGTWVDGTPVWRKAFDTTLTELDISDGVWGLPQLISGSGQRTKLKAIINSYVFTYPNNDYYSAIRMKEEEDGTCCRADSFCILTSRSKAGDIVRGYVDFVADEQDVDFS